MLCAPQRFFILTEESKEIGYWNAHAAALLADARRLRRRARVARSPALATAFLRIARARRDDARNVREFGRRICE